MRKAASSLLSVLVVSSLAVLTQAQAPTPSPSGSWTLTGAMSQARSGAAAAVLHDGTVLVTGGTDASGAVSASAEIFGAHGTFTPVAPMNYPRTGHTATWVPNPLNASGGYVLVTGGSSSGGAVLASAELYDPVSNTWTLLAQPMIDARSGHPASPLPNSSVLLSGGSNGSGPLSSLEQFDLSTQQFAFAGTLPTARTSHAAAALLDGRVLLVGGTGANGNTLADTVLYDPGAGTVAPGPNLSTPRANATATTLLDGTVLIAGGRYPEGAAAHGNIAELQSAEIFDPVAGTITVASANLVQARAGHLAFLLPNNNAVLLVGGSYNGSDLASAEVYTPWLAQFAATGSMSVPRSSATGAPLFPLADGQLLVAGGSNLSSAELYGFATVETDLSDYAPGTPVIMSGTGWQPNETVSLYMQALPATANVAPLMTTVADASGNILDGAWAPDTSDIGARFYLTAVGASSGWQAQTTFTDTATPTTTITISGNGSVKASRSSGTVTISSCSGNCSFSNTGTPQATCTSGTCTVNWSGSYNATLAATASGGYTFSGWSGTGGCTGTGNCSASGSGNKDFAAIATFAGAVSASVSTVGANPTTVTADGSTASTITVTLLDANSNPVRGKAVSLTAGSGSSAVSTPSGSSDTTGKVTFTVKDTKAEAVTYTANDTTDNITIAATATVTFTAGAVSGSVSTVAENPSSVVADGVTASTITVTLLDANSNPVSGKAVSLTAGSGSSAISAPSGSSGSSDTTGKVTFTVTDTKAEAVTYTAKDTTDKITIAATTTVTFTAGPAAKLVFTADPSNSTTAGVAFATQPVVSVQDANGNPVNSTIAITLAIGSNPSGGALSCGNNPLNATGGTATFANCKIDKYGTHYTLTASATSLAGATGGTFNITSRSSGTGVVLNPASVTVGQASTATVTVTDNGAGTQSNPGGTLALQSSDTGDSMGSCTLSSSGANAATCTATVTPSAVGTGSHTITASYTATDGIHANSSGPATLTVSKATPAITWSNPADITYGTALSSTQLDATASVAGTYVYTPAAGASLHAGNGQTLSVTFTPTDTTNYTTASASVTINVNKASPVVNWSPALPSSALYNSSFTAAAITNSTGAITYNVTGGCSLNSSTGAVTMTSGVTGCSVTANVAADDNYNAGSLGPTSVAAVPAGALVTLGNLIQTYSGSPEPVSVSTTPTGLNVVFSYTAVNGTSYGPTATAPTNPGSYSVTGTVVNDNYAGLDTETLTINQLDPALNLALRAGMSEPSSYGSPVYFQLMMANAPCPTGTVQFYVDGQASGSAVTLSGTSCSDPVPFSVTDLLTGAHTVYAAYSGDVIYSAANSTTVSHSISVDSTSIALATSGNSITVGQNVTFTATVSPSNLDSTALAPRGIVQFFEDGNLLGEAPLSSTSPYVAIYSTSSLSSGSHAISATFVDSDGLFATSSSTLPLSEKVNKISPYISWPNPPNVVYGTALGSSQLNAVALDPSNNPISGSFAYNPPINTVLQAGQITLQVTFTPDDQNTYSVQPASTTLNVAPAPLAITPNSLSRNYYAGNPAFPYTITGYVNGDTSAVVSGAASCTTTAVLSSPYGPYPITCTRGTLAAGTNYSFSFAGGTLTVLGLHLAEQNVTPTGTATAGGKLQVGETVNNQGNISAGSSVTFFYLSKTSTGRDTYIGSRSVPGLASNAASPGTTSLALPPSVNGPYYVVACANGNGQLADSIPASTCTGTSMINVAGADLVESVSGPSTGAAGMPISVNAKTTNQGAGTAGDSITYFYLSTTPTGRSTYIGSASVATLTPGSSAGPATSRLTLPMGINGTYYVVACANATGAVAEIDFSNDCAATGAINVSGADLVESVTGPASAIAGQSITVNATTTNSGAGYASDSITYFYLSTTPTGRNTYLGGVSVPSLAGNNGSASVQRTLTLPTGISGTYYIVGCANATGAVVESNYSNDCGGTASITVTAH